MAEVLCEYPRVVHETRFLSEAEVLHLLNVAEAKFVRSTVVDNESGDSVVDDYRTGQLAPLLPAHDAVVKAIEERIAAVTGTRVAQGEAIQVVKYSEGDQYKVHSDWFDPAQPGSIKQLKFGGQRIATCILYLQMPEEGGETEFPNVTLKVKPVAGDALFFWNLTKEGKPEILASHAGLPPVKGSKVIATRWLRERAADGSEEKEALVTKNLEKSRVEEAKVAAIKAQQDLAAAVEVENNMRTQVCYEELMTVLRKHRCKMFGMPGVQIGNDGVMRLMASVELEALPEEQKKS